MKRDSGASINSLIRNWPKDVPRTSSCLKEQGYSYQLLYRYEQSGWIESIGKGAYIRAGDEISWTGAVSTLQTELSLPVRIGGISSLNNYGYGQYLQAADRVFLFGVVKKRLPRWFLSMMDKHEMLVESARQLGEIPLSSLSTLSYGSISVYGSPPELAFMEMLMQVPGKISFQEASEVSEGLNSLRAEILSLILESSKSVKANRLALYFGDHFSHPWRSKITEDKVDLGSGKRTIVAGGRLDTRYQIVVSGEDDVF